MIIQLKKEITSGQKELVLKAIENQECKWREIETQLGSYLLVLGKIGFDIRLIGNLPGITDIHRVTDDFKLVSGKWKTHPTVVEVDSEVSIGGSGLTLMAGPCSIEGEEQILATVEILEKLNIRIMRGGVFKPRSSPYSYRGAGIDGLKLWHSICAPRGIKIISEVMEMDQIDAMYPYIDIYQVGARNSQNFNLLDALGRVDKPVMIKRGLSGTIDELLYSAEYVFSGGNEKIILCERGIRTYEKAYRNTFDINAIPILKEKSHLPVIADPSHGTGIRSLVEPIALASVAAGADGIIVEIHRTPEKATSDAMQTLDFEEFGRLCAKARAVYGLVTS
jgi:3-deoxy-7-phosphoheptulonate synthase